MKKSYIILLVVIIVALAILFLRHCQIVSAAPNVPVKNSNPQLVTAKVTAAAEVVKAEPSKPSSFAAAFSAPIIFYGRVQTQDGLPIAAAEIHAEVADQLGGGSSKISSQSDPQGLFKITSKGLTLSIRVSKEGYFSIPEKEGKAQRSTAAFDYGANMGSGIHQPDEKSPVVFTLYKPSALEPLNRVREKEVPMPRDGKAVSVPLDIPSHQVMLKCFSFEERKERDGRYDWKLEVSVVGGGLQRRNDDFSFVAPSEGFQPNDTIQMPRTLARAEWHDDFEQSYWLRFDDGTFGSVKVRMIAGGAHYAIIKGYLNPKQGSRNLETDPSKRW